jgi:hypothetical protein
VVRVAFRLLGSLYLWPMPVKARALMMPTMTSPLSARKVVLIPAPSAPEISGQPPIRRYRVARLRFDTPSPSFPKRYEYLKRTFD